MKVALPELHRLAAAALCAANTSPENAAAVADALVAAEADGIASHGLSRVPFYADQARSGKVDGQARPVVTTPATAAVVVDACHGFAFPAIKAGLERAAALVRDSGVAAAGITRSHHFGAGGYHVEAAARQGLLALGFSNSPAAMAPWGGRKGTLGTNPIAFACPRAPGRDPLVIDLSLSKVARGKIMLAKQQGDTIPPTWAFDAKGAYTTDPDRALAGTMAPVGDAKGAALALMVEILAAALTGGNFAFQASSFFTAEGSPPGIGQFFVLIAPQAFGDAFPQRVEVLLDEILSQRGTRLPGARRLALRAQAQRDGVEVPDALLQDLTRRAGASC